MMKMKTWKFWFVGLLLVRVANGAMIIDSFQSVRHDRFANSSQFIGANMGDAFDLSGIARASDGRWVTMISPSHFISAYHFRPELNSTVEFIQGNDANGLRTTRQVVEGQQVGNTDLWIGRLDSPVDDGIKIYPMAQDVGIMGPTVYQIGNSPSGKLGDNVTTDFAVGRNILDRFGNTQLNDSFFHYAGYTDDTALGDLTGGSQPEANLIQDETFYQEFDSGAPTLIFQNGKIELLGIHSFIAEISTAPPHTTVERRFSGDVYLPTYHSQIESTMATLVPEPSAASLLALGLLAWFAIQRKRR
ncbi:MAG: PEP-CTERM sorting domain-containing protein [Planctomycetales bacterium]|nr:PEP-CTERM sorting domain-containing protein [Planctomycetales bacterium]